MDLPPRQAVELLRQLALQNIEDLGRILQWNAEHGITLFRISSGLFPHIGDWQMAQDFRRVQYFRGNIDFAVPALQRVGRYAREHGMRLTFHTNPYCQLGALDDRVLRNTLFDLAVYTRVLQALGTEDGCIIIHGGGVYGDKAATLSRVEARVRRLPASIRRQIVFENDERHYSPFDLLPMCERLGVPFCLDVFHNAISADHVPLTPRLIGRVLRTWGSRTPKFHLSDQERGGRFGAHAQTVRAVPEWLVRLGTRRRIDLMIEAKSKEQAVLKLIPQVLVLSSK